MTFCLSTADVVVLELFLLPFSTDVSLPPPPPEELLLFFSFSFFFPLHLPPSLLDIFLLDLEFNAEAIAASSDADDTLPVSDSTILFALLFFLLLLLLLLLLLGD